MILDEIVRFRREDVEQARRSTPVAALRQTALYAEPRRGFLAALQRPGVHIVAEVKKASPSKGTIRADMDPVAIAHDYATNGATAISVLTEERYFQGKGAYLSAIRARVSLPLLRKDFIFDPYQITESRALGADAVLLILAMLGDASFRRLRDVADEEGLDVLVEVHDDMELDRALAAGVALVGINNRDLRTFATTLAVTERLAARVAPGVTLLSESGIDTASDVARLRRCGVRCFLVGEALMRAALPGDKLRELLGEG